MSAPSETWIPPESFTTKRLLIRSWREGDGAALSEAVRASYEHLAPWMPWATPDQGEAESERNVRASRGRWLLRTDFTLALFSPDGSRVLGGSGFHLREGTLETCRAEIGMWIHGSEAGTGLGSEVLAGLLEWGFTAWPWERLSWRCDPANAASARVAEKAGLRFEGIQRARQEGVDGTPRDVACYAMLRSDWTKTSP